MFVRLIVLKQQIEMLKLVWWISVILKCFWWINYQPLQTKNKLINFTGITTSTIKSSERIQETFSNLKYKDIRSMRTDVFRLAHNYLCATFLDCSVVFIIRAQKIFFRGVFRTQPNIYDGAVNYFCEKSSIVDV